MTLLRVFIDHNDFTNCMSSVSHFERPVTSIAYVWHAVDNHILKYLTHPFEKLYTRYDAYFSLQPSLV